MPKSKNKSKIFSTRLRCARNMRKLSQSNLAIRAGFDSSSISHFETSIRKPSFESLIKLSNALNVTTDYLLGRTKDPEVFNGLDDPLFRDFKNLPTESRNFAHEFIISLAKKNCKK